jgi:hypothetical protein
MANEFDVGSILVEIKADIKQLQASLKEGEGKVHESASVMKEGFNELKKTIVEVFSLNEIKNFVKESIKEFTEMQDALNDLGNTVKAGGGNWKGLKDDVEAYTKGAAASTRFNSTEITKSLDSITFKVGDVSKAMQLNNEAMKLARVRHIDLASAADIVSNAYLGNEKGVSMLARSLGVTGAKAKDAGKLFDILDAKTKKLGDDSQTVAFQLNQASKAYKQMQEDVGAALAPAVTFWAKLGQEWIPNVIKAVQSAGIYIGEFVAKGIIYFGAFARKVEALSFLIQEVFTSPKKALADFNKRLEDGAKQTGIEIVNIEKATADELAKIWKKSAETKATITKGNVAMEAHANQLRIRDEELAQARIKSIIMSTAEGYKTLAADITKAALTSKEAWQDIGKAMIRSVLDALIAVLQAYEAEAMAEAIAALYEEDYKTSGEKFLAAGAYQTGEGVLKGIESAYLAEGGVVTKPTNAVIGEGGEPEAVVPLSKAGEMGFGGQVTQHIGIHLPNVKKPADFASAESRRTISRVLSEQMTKLQARQGLRFSGRMLS